MQSQVGEIYDGKVTGLTTFGAFVKMSNGETGMVHISEVAAVYVKDIKDYLTDGQDVKVKVLAINENNKISLSIKQTVEQPQQNTNNEFKRRKPQPKGNFTPHDNNQGGPKRDFAPRAARPTPAGPASFEDMMAKFKQESDEKMSDLKRSSDSRYGASRRGNSNKQ